MRKDISETVEKAGYKMTPHTIDRAVQRQIKGDEILKIINTGEKQFYQQDNELMIGYRDSSTGNFVAKISDTNVIRTVIDNTSKNYLKNIGERLINK